jgi:serine/threonine protein kinase
MSAQPRPTLARPTLVPVYSDSPKKPAVARGGCIGARAAECVTMLWRKATQCCCSNKGAGDASTKKSVKFYNQNETVFSVDDFAGLLVKVVERESGVSIAELQEHLDPIGDLVKGYFEGDSGKVYFIMEEIHGIDLERFTKILSLRPQGLPEGLVTKWIFCKGGLVYQVADQLKQIHKKFPHLDVKPENLVLKVEGGSIKVILIDPADRNPWRHVGDAEWNPRVDNYDATEFYLPQRASANEIRNSQDIFALCITALQLALYDLGFRRSSYNLDIKGYGYATKILTDSSKVRGGIRISPKVLDFFQESFSCFAKIRKMNLENFCKAFSEDQLKSLTLEGLQDDIAKSAVTLGADELGQLAKLITEGYSEGDNNNPGEEFLPVGLLERLQEIAQERKEVAIDGVEASKTALSASRSVATEAGGVYSFSSSSPSTDGGHASWVSDSDDEDLSLS